MKNHGLLGLFLGTGLVVVVSAQVGAADLVLHPAGLDRTQVVQLQTGKMAKMYVAAVDGQKPAELRKARKILLAPGPHRLTLQGIKFVITGMSISMNRGGGLASASVQGEEEEAEVALVFEALAGQRYRLTCDREATCEVQDGNKKTVSSEPKAEAAPSPIATPAAAQ